MRSVIVTIIRRDHRARIHGDSREHSEGQDMDFNLDTYKRRTGRLQWADLDLAGAFHRQPLDADTLRCLRYMHDVEFHTVCYLRDLLLSPAHGDPEVTAFLSFWVYEEFWHGEAIADVLAAHSEAAGEERIAGLRHSLGLRNRLGPLLTMAAGGILGRDFVALHMTWGAINEWTTQAGYARLTQLAGHPVLSELLRRIMRQEGRHIDFYAAQAENRLASSQRAQRVTRFALRRFWHPVGAGVMPAAETEFLARHLFSGDEGRRTAARIDRRVDRLPGLAGLHLLERAAERSLVHRPDSRSYQRQAPINSTATRSAAPLALDAA